MEPTEGAASRAPLVKPENMDAEAKERTACAEELRGKYTGKPEDKARRKEGTSEMNREEVAGAKDWSRTNIAIQKRTHRNWETVADRDKRDATKAAAAGTTGQK